MAGAARRLGSLALGGLAGGASVNSRGITIAAYVATTAVLVLLYIAGLTRRLGLVPLGELMDAVGSSRSGRLALIVCWAWLGWHFLAR
jgi:Family of unknown function (DUF6186)